MSEHNSTSDAKLADDIQNGAGDVSNGAAVDDVEMEAELVQINVQLMAPDVVGGAHADDRTEDQVTELEEEDAKLHAQLGGVAGLNSQLSAPSLDDVANLPDDEAFSATATTAVAEAIDGHDEGDSALRAAAEALRDESDQEARKLLDGLKDEFNSAMKVMDSVGGRISDEVAMAHGELQLPSVGEKTPEDALSAADSISQIVPISDKPSSKRSSIADQIPPAKTPSAPSTPRLSVDLSKSPLSPPQAPTEAQPLLKKEILPDIQHFPRGSLGLVEQILPLDEEATLSEVSAGGSAPAERVSVASSVSKDQKSKDGSISVASDSAAQASLEEQIVSKSLTQETASFLDSATMPKSFSAGQTPEVSLKEEVASRKSSVGSQKGSLSQADEPPSKKSSLADQKKEISQAEEIPSKRSSVSQKPNVGQIQEETPPLKKSSGVSPKPEVVQVVETPSTKKSSVASQKAAEEAPPEKKGPSVSQKPDVAKVEETLPSKTSPVVSQKEEEIPSKKVPPSPTVRRTSAASDKDASSQKGSLTETLSTAGSKRGSLSGEQPSSISEEVSLKQDKEGIAKKPKDEKAVEEVEKKSPTARKFKRDKTPTKTPSKRAGAKATDLEEPIAQVTVAALGEADEKSSASEAEDKKVKRRGAKPPGKADLQEAKEAKDKEKAEAAPAEPEKEEISEKEAAPDEVAGGEESLENAEEVLRGDVVEPDEQAPEVKDEFVADKKIEEEEIIPVIEKAPLASAPRSYEQEAERPKSPRPEKPYDDVAPHAGGAPARSTFRSDYESDYSYKRPTPMYLKTFEPHVPFASGLQSRSRSRSRPSSYSRYKERRLRESSVPTNPSYASMVPAPLSRSTSQTTVGGAGYDLRRDRSSSQIREPYELGCSSSGILGPTLGSRIDDWYAKQESRVDKYVRTINEPLGASFMHHPSYYRPHYNYQPSIYGLYGYGLPSYGASYSKPSTNYFGTTSNYSYASPETTNWPLYGYYGTRDYYQPTYYANYYGNYGINPITRSFYG